MPGHDRRVWHQLDVTDLTLAAPCVRLRIPAYGAECDGPAMAGACRFPRYGKSCSHPWSTDKTSAMTLIMAEPLEPCWRTGALEPEISGFRRALGQALIRRAP